MSFVLSGAAINTGSHVPGVGGWYSREPREAYAMYGSLVGLCRRHRKNLRHPKRLIDQRQLTFRGIGGVSIAHQVSCGERNSAEVCAIFESVASSGVL